LGEYADIQDHRESGIIEDATMKLFAEGKERTLTRKETQTARKAEMSG